MCRIFRNRFDQTNLTGFGASYTRLLLSSNSPAYGNDFAVEYENAKFQLLAGGDKEELTKAEDFLDKANTGEKELAAKLLKGSASVTSSEALLEAWRKTEAHLGLLYLFGHANARTMGFSINDTMDVIAFKNSLKKSKGSPRCLVFLNGCYTSNPELESGTFLEATGRQGFCGYIGAETEVPGVVCV